jgi:uncharacterized protein
MNKSRPSRLRFNFGFLLEAPIGTFREVELNYPSIQVVQDMTLAPLTGSFLATRISEGIYLSGVLKSKMEQRCVRCLEDTKVSLTLQIDELFYYPPGPAPEGAYVVGENGYIDLAPLVRELAWLDVPIQPLCKPDCQGLCMECGQNLNHENCNCEMDDIDPRLSVLKELLD